MNYNIQSRGQGSLILSLKFWTLTILLVLLYTAIIFAQSTVYIDPTNSGDPGQNGTLDHPYDSWTDFSVQDNTTYLQKRGTTSILTGYINIENKSHVTIGTYGEGDRPHLMQMVSNSNVFRVNRSSHIRIEGFKVEMPVGSGSGVISISAHGTNGTAYYNYVTDCEIIGGWRGINSEVWPSEATCDIGNLYVEDCIIHEQTDDGIFCKTRQNAAYDTIVVRGCHIYRVNLTWLTNPSESGGDPIHLLRCNNFLIENNILDKRITSYKFCFISAMGALGTEKGIVRFNTMYPPKDTVGYSSNVFYIGPGHDSVWFYGNKFIGRGYTNGQHAGAAGYFVGNYANFSYNLFDSVGYIAIATPTEYKEFNNNIVRFIQFGSSSSFLATGNQPTYLRNNIFLMPNGTQLFNDAGAGGVNVFEDNNIELYSDDLQGFDDIMHFADINNYDYHLTENSTLARNQGIEYIGAIDCDADNVPVPMENFRDIGAFEYFDNGQTNSPPVILAQAFGIDESSANGTVVGTVIATDPDAGQTLTYSIESGNTSNAFQIGATSGVITINNSSAVDFETTPSFSLTIKVQDNGIGYLSDQATITINLNDLNENPNMEDQSFSVSENSPNGYDLGTLVASDPDNGQTLTFTIISGNTNNAFDIGINTARLTVANSSAINFEVIPEFTLVVEVEDNGSGNLTDQAIISVTVNDMNEPPAIGPQNFTIDENSSNSTQVGTVLATDPDNGQSLTYSIVSGNMGNAFEIAENSGVLTVSNSTILNFEVIPEIELTIEVEDDGMGNLSSSAQITISLLDVNEPPIIPEQSLDVDVEARLIQHEINGLEFSVGLVTASDPDEGQSVAFSIIAGNDKNVWSMNANTGEIKLINPYLLNPNEINNYPIVVEVADNSVQQLTTSAELIINVNIYTDNSVAEENQTTSENNIIEMVYSIYPNPAKSYLKYDLENIITGPISITITNLNGETVFQQNYTESNGKLSRQIDLNGFSQGMYIIYFRNGNMMKYDKFIKL